jgi:hypothetical protein
LEAAAQKRRGKAPAEPCDKPEPKAQRNFTDPDSRIMKDGASKAFEQCYNAQAAVDEEAQIIVAAEVTQETNDKRQVVPMVAAIEQTMREVNGPAQEAAGRAAEAAVETDAPRRLPQALSADNGYFSEENIQVLETEKIDAYVATGRLKHGESPPEAAEGEPAEGASVKEKMALKLRTVKGRATYSKRKQIVEPVFGQIKEVRGIRRFLLRGLEEVQAEWKLICATHNLLKLWRRSGAPARS